MRFIVLTINLLRNVNDVIELVEIRLNERKNAANNIDVMTQLLMYSYDLGAEK